MARRFLVVLLLLGASAVSGKALAQESRGLISQVTALRHGLTRAWFTQVGLDTSRDQIGSVLAQGDAVFVQTKQGVVQAIEAETGRTLWNVQVGRHNLVTTALGADTKHVALLNGSTLYLLDRATGRTLWERKTASVAGAGPALSREWAYVPSLRGGIEVFSLETPQQSPWSLPTVGMAETQPLFTGTSLAWVTDRGFLYVAGLDTHRIHFRAEVKRPNRESPAYHASKVLVSSREGMVYAYQEATGTEVWRFSTGEVIDDAPVVIKDAAYVVTVDGGMYQLSAATGAEQWWTPEATQFMAASPTRVYASDRLGRILVLSASTGALIDAIQAEGLPLRPVNQATDRVYVGTPTGLLVCLRETELVQPVINTPPVVEPASTADKVKAAAPKPGEPKTTPAPKPAPKPASKPKPKPAEEGAPPADAAEPAADGAAPDMNAAPADGAAPDAAVAPEPKPLPAPKVAPKPKTPKAAKAPSKPRPIPTKKRASKRGAKAGGAGAEDSSFGQPANGNPPGNGF